jgi:hypothetical protein
MVAVSPRVILSGEEISICPKPRLSCVDALAVVRMSPFGWREASTFDRAMEFGGGVREVTVLVGSEVGVVTAGPAVVGLAGGRVGWPTGTGVGAGAQLEISTARIAERTSPLTLIMYPSPRRCSLDSDIVLHLIKQDIANSAYFF